ncbi:MAG: copper chaperone PCu(A)C, partial [Pseudonocardiaceae bacterium]
MSRRHSSMRRPLAVTALVAVCCAAAVALAGCGAGQITQTDSQVAAVPGAYGDVGSIALRNVL